MKYYIAIILTAALSLLTVHAGDTPQTEAIKSKLETIILPDIHFENTPLRNTLDKLKTLSVSADSETDIEKRGVNIVLIMGPESADAIEITTSLKHPTLGQAFAEIAKQAKCRVIVESYAVAIVPQDH